VVVAAVVAVMSVQPTSEKRTGLQLAGSCAAAVPAVTATKTAAPAIAFRKACIVFSLSLVWRDPAHRERASAVDHRNIMPQAMQVYFD
jgi:hypothetical protein